MLPLSGIVANQFLSNLDLRAPNAMAGAAKLVAPLRGLEVHHIQLKSQCGRDSEGNLITLCSECHRRIHEAR